MGASEFRMGSRLKKKERACLVDVFDFFVPRRRRNTSMRRGPPAGRSCLFARLFPPCACASLYRCRERAEGTDEDTRERTRAGSEKDCRNSLSPRTIAMGQTPPSSLQLLSLHLSSRPSRERAATLQTKTIGSALALRAGTRQGGACRKRLVEEREPGFLVFFFGGGKNKE
jgi:hypothetical protein